MRTRHVVAVALLALLAVVALGSGYELTRSENLLVSDPGAATYLLSPPVERQSVGLEPIPASGEVRIVREYSLHFIGTGKPDVRVEFERPHFIKTVFLEPAKAGHRWFAEEDTHYGPLSYELSFGESEREHIYIEYSERNGHYVSYNGPRPGLSSDYRGLDLADVVPLLEEWRSQQQ